MPQTVFITGASTGFGRATARHFARAGWNVVATMRTPTAELAGPTTLVTRLDVLDRASIDAAVAAARARFGTLDVVVNNAGYGLFGIFEETPPEALRAQLDVNLFGAMDVTRAVLPMLRAQRRGVIVNVSSGAGIFTLPALSSYCASKFALEGWSEALAYELAAVGIVVKILEPGGVITTEFGARGAAESAANAPIADYAPFLARTQAIFAALRGQRLATEEDVAEALFAAATDGTPQLRYVATADIAPLVAARRETSEASYLALVRGRFT